MLRNLLLSTFLSLKAHKLRVFLTMVGIIIGIAAVVTVSSIGEGMKQSSLKMLDSTGSNVVRLIYRPDVDEDSDSPGEFETYAFSKNDLKLLRKLDNITTISADYGYGFGADESIQVSLSYFDNLGGDQVIANPGNGKNTVAYGRDFIPSDAERNVIILSYQTMKFSLMINKPDKLIGRAIDVDGEKFLVVGIKNEPDDMGMNMDPNLFNSVIPKKAFNNLSKSKSINAIKLKVAADADRNQIVEEANEKLKEYHPELTGNFEEDKSSEQMRQEVENMIQQVVMGLVFITAISLLVGGIGVMNIMYVSVSERKREIGIRRAIGAKPANIMAQFLLEAAFITLLGGVIGILLGWGISQLISTIPGIEAILSVKMTLISAGVSIAIGLIFGVIPAINAAKMDPIKAIYQ